MINFVFTQFCMGVQQLMHEELNIYKTSYSMNVFPLPYLHTISEVKVLR